jgi:site-specific DNA-methyltransferase (adenine-specific)
MVQPNLIQDRLQELFPVHYRNGNILMINADCMDVMKHIQDKEVELSCVDPPYGIGEALVAGGTWSKKWQSKGAGWNVKPNSEYFNELFRVSGNWVIWGGNYFMGNLPDCRSFIAWHKPYMDGMHTMANVELAFTSFDRNAECISINKGQDRREHITQKPISLYKYILSRYAKPGDRILDTHGGSGSICIACHDLGYDLTWMELDKDYYDAAVARYKLHASQGQLFEPAPPGVVQNNLDY